MATIISGFPNSLPGANERRDKRIGEEKLKIEHEGKKAKLKEIFPEMKSLLLNWTILFNSLGVSVLLIFVGALVPFLGKIVQLKFGLDPVKNGLVLFGVMTPSVMGMYKITICYISCGSSVGQNKL